MKSFVALLTLLGLAGAAQSSEAPNQDRCTGLVLGGGGSFVAYGIGFVDTLLHKDDPEAIAAGKYHYDIVTGVSGGSINAAAMAAWPIGQEVEMIEWLSALWNATTTDEIVEKWDAWDPIVDGLLHHSGIYSLAPLQNYSINLLSELGDRFGNQFHRMLNVMATDIDTGDLFQFTDQTLVYEDFYQAIMASTAFPFAFPFYRWGNHTFVDGIVEYGPDLPTAIQRCREKVDSDSQITIDTMITYPGGIDVIEEPSHNAFENFLRKRAIKQYENGLDQVLAYMMYFPEVNFRWFGVPSKDMGNNRQRINFDSDFTWSLQELGHHDAEKALEQGEGKVFEHLKAFAALSKEEKKGRSARSYLNEVLQ